MNEFRIFFLALVLFVLSFPVIQDSRGSWSLVSEAADAQEDWRTEFDDICGKTQDAMVFNQEELKNLISRCDKVRSLIEKLEGAQKKVYLKRLQMCRDLFSFALESKEKK
jgi:hypothetical protein